MEKKLQTPSQTVGPYFAYGLTPEQYNYDFKSLAGPIMVSDPDAEDIITISGIVYDGKDQPIDDAMIELWQKDNEAEAFGRCGTGTDPQNKFIFKTRKPKPVGDYAPFISVIVFMRGQLIHSYTRLYFSDEVELNEKDEVLSSIPKERRETIIAQKKGNRYEFNIYMQGEKETVFFDV